jgi:acyl carrier protein
MDKATIRAAVVAAITKVQDASGRPPPDMSGNVVPIGDLDAFDSLSGVEATVLIEKELGCELSQGSAFVTPDGRKALTISGVVDRVEAMIVQKGAA